MAIRGFQTKENEGGVCSLFVIICIFAKNCWSKLYQKMQRIKKENQPKNNKKTTQPLKTQRLQTCKTEGFIFISLPYLSPLCIPLTDRQNNGF